MTRVWRVLAAATQGLLGLMAVNLLPLPARAGDRSAHVGEVLQPKANILHMADWVTRSHDNGGKPFAIIDKQNAKAFVFDQNGRMLGSAWVLVGLATGDESVPGVGTMPLTAITPDIRTTPAGRFVARLGHDLEKEVLWVDYANAISLHRVINTNPAERRLERIASQAPAEHRISYGCINVPAKFFDGVIEPTFKGTSGIVYILPEVKPLRSVFPGYSDGDDGTRQDAANSGGATEAAWRKSSGSVEDHDLSGIVH